MIVRCMWRFINLKKSCFPNPVQNKRRFFLFCVINNSLCEIKGIINVVQNCQKIKTLEQSGIKSGIIRRIFYNQIMKTNKIPICQYSNIIQLIKTIPFWLTSVCVRVWMYNENPAKIYTIVNLIVSGHLLFGGIYYQRSRQQY